MKYLLFSLAFLFTATGFFVSPSTPPDRIIKGTVVDNSNSPLIGANVMACNHTVGVVTDLDGRFTLTIPDSCPTIEIAYTGYFTQVISLGKSDSLHIVLQAGVELNECVITALGVTREKRNLSYATTTVNIKGRRAGATGYYLDGISAYPSSTRTEEHKPYSGQQTDTFNTEDYDDIKENTFHRPTDAPLSTFSIDVDVASYANVRRYLSYGQEPPKDAVRIEELVNYFDYDYPQPNADHPIAIITEVGECPWSLDHKLVHIGLQGKTIPTADLPASNLVFLIDVSGSMMDENKLPLVIESFKILTENLREKDRVAIVVYAGAAGLVLPSTSGANKTKILDALQRLQAGGSTAGAEGIKLAYQEAQKNFIKNGNNRVILATDGDFNIGISSDGDLINLIEKERESGVFLTTLGYGMGNYKDNKLEKLADHGNGNHGYVDNLSEAKKVFVYEFGGTLFTIAKDVKIQVEFNPSLVAGYRLIGYENRMLASEDFNDDKKDAGEMGSGHTVTALYEIIPAGVKSDFLKSVDDLKYQKTKNTATSNHSDELMTVKFRYKDPEGTESKLLEQVIANTFTPFESTSENFRWSAAVASFGMLLRDSEFDGTSNFADVEKWAIASKGVDEHGYRDEFIKMVRGTKKIAFGKDDEPVTERK